MVKKPLIVLNFKTYAESMGENAVRMAKYCEEVSEESGVEVIAVPQIPDILRIVGCVNIPVYAQHIDGVGAGGYTGHINADCVRAAGARGCLINHSERRLLMADVDSAVHAAKKAGLTAVVCTNNISVTSAAAALSPEYVAIEPPALIGTGISVSKADPGIVAGSVEAAKKINSDVKVLCGAGISTGDDVAAALELGTYGVLLASGVIKARDQKAALIELIGKV